MPGLEILLYPFIVIRVHMSHALLRSVKAHYFIILGSLSDSMIDPSRLRQAFGPIGDADVFNGLVHHRGVTTFPYDLQGFHGSAGQCSLPES